MDSIANLVLIMFAIILIYAVITYICQAVGLYKVAGKFGKNNRWMAFIPILNMYLIGICVDEEDPYILHAGWVATLVNIFMTVFVDNKYIILFGTLLLTIATVYYIYQISVKLNSSGIVQAILAFFGFSPFVYLYLGLKEEKGKVALEENIKPEYEVLSGTEIESVSESKFDSEFNSNADNESE
ncbi:hypothetical protein [Lacrimispora amygdalina]|uniref:hypothetical protein n=1 Tax=Lacrimispora amygdalina TaxID=253257 RepID=UPI000BE24C61|nr:hypothetical protein [Lacrimispora amygdalina]